MERVTVLSPHRDDAVFSMGLVLEKLSSRPIRISVINFFTESAYAPFAQATSIEDATQIRKSEDLAALAAISTDIQEISLKLEDAPVRLGISFDQIMRDETQTMLTELFLRELQGRIESTAAGSLVAAPLAVGIHVDHVAVRRAVLQSGVKEVAFYEDLPYTARTTSDEVLARIDDVEESIGQKLEPHLVQTPGGAVRKQELAAYYRSQISAAEAHEIGQFARTYGEGERLWIPEHSQRWKALCAS